MLITRSTATDVSMRADKEVVKEFVYVCVGDTAAVITELWMLDVQGQKVHRIYT